MTASRKFCLDFEVEKKKMAHLEFGKFYEVPQIYATVVGDFGLIWRIVVFPKGLQFRNGNKKKVFSAGVKLLNAKFLKAAGLNPVFGFTLVTAGRAGGPPEWPEEELEVDMTGARKLGDGGGSPWIKTGLSDGGDKKAVVGRCCLQFLTEEFSAGAAMSGRLRALSECGANDAMVKLFGESRNKVSEVCDVTIECADGTIGASKAVLVMQSDYFAKLFNFNRQKISSESSEVEMEKLSVDFSPYDKAAVAVMVEHLYLGRKVAGPKTQLTPAQVIQLLQLADQINPPRVKLLHAFAEKTILANRDEEEGVSELLAVAERYAMPVLRNALVATAATTQSPTDTKKLSKELREEISQLRRGLRGVTAVDLCLKTSLNTTV